MVADGFFGVGLIGSACLVGLVTCFIVLGLFKL